MSSSPPENWPPGIEQISMENLGRLGIDSADRLFWDGRQIEVKRRLDLTFVQKIFAVVVAVMAVLGGLGGFATGFNDFSEFLCARNSHLLSCPAEPAVHPLMQAQSVK